MDQKQSTKEDKHTSSSSEGSFHDVQESAVTTIGAFASPVDQQADVRTTSEVDRVTSQVSKLAVELTAVDTTSDQRVRSKSAEECLEIINAKTLGRLGIQQNLLKQHEARAGPNERIKTAFGVYNSFTMYEQDASNKFRAMAKKIIQFDMQTWPDVVATAQAVVRSELKDVDSQLNLTDVTQAVALKTAMSILFHDIDVVDPNKHDAIKTIAKEINEQWMRSKVTYDGNEQPDWAFEKQTRLLAALQTVFPDFRPDARKSNPLNLILPAYETVWRVVLRGFLELTSRGHENAQHWREVLAAFLDNPTKTQLEDGSGKGSGVSAEHIAKEALRLYAPTRRVYREYQTSDGKSFEAAANIEGSHRNKGVWGDGVLRFEPDRWTTTDLSSLNESFMAFGARPFMCPAGQSKFPTEPQRSPFGLTFVAVLVGAMTAGLAGQWHVMGTLPNVETPLSTDRDAYGDERLAKAH